MRSSKTELADYSAIAKSHGLAPEEVKSIVSSFFDTISSGAKSLKFDNPRKIFSKPAFESASAGKVVNIPYIGRIGPIYSRYLKWRRNEAKGITMIPRQKIKKGLTQDEIETIAEIVLGGGQYVRESKRKNNFKRVWLVGTKGKTQARQVIPKREKDV